LPSYRLLSQPSTEPDAAALGWWVCIANARARVQLWREQATLVGDRQTVHEEGGRTIL
jgi:hypothetical protein